MEMRRLMLKFEGGTFGTSRKRSESSGPTSTMAARYLSVLFVCLFVFFCFTHSFIAFPFLGFCPPGRPGNERKRGVPNR